MNLHDYVLILHEISNNVYPKLIRLSNRDVGSDTTVGYWRRYRAPRSGLRGPVRPDPEDHVADPRVQILIYMQLPIYNYYI